MDDYTLKEIKRIIDDNMLTPELLNSIFESVTRHLEIYNDKENLDILMFLESSEKIPNNIKNEISSFLLKYNKYSIIENEEDVESDKRIPFIYIIVGLIFISVGFAFYFFN